MQEFIEKLIGRLEEELPLYVGKAKEIVIELAEEYNNDFCEWKDSIASDFYKVSCKGLKFICKHGVDFKYCPYCGKKIERAE